MNLKIIKIILAILIITSLPIFYIIYMDMFNKNSINSKQAPMPTKAQTASKPSPPKTAKSNNKKIKKENKFSIEIVDVKESGMLSRVITAKLINNDGYAKNVKVTLELFVDNDRVRINGKDALTIVVGNMDAKSSIEKEVEISVGFFDGLKIKSKGYVDAKLTISWNKGKEIFKKRIRI